MKLSHVKEQLQSLETLQFKLPDGTLVPEHFHVTEVGVTTKSFIDCGGEYRDEKVLSFQLWTADDTDHRLAPEKFLKIIELSQRCFSSFDELEVEVEYQTDTIGRYGLEEFDGVFHLTTKQTDCLAKDKCGIPQQPPMSKQELLQCCGIDVQEDCCGDTGCC